MVYDPIYVMVVLNSFNPFITLSQFPFINKLPAVFTQQGYTYTLSYTFLPWGQNLFRIRNVGFLEEKNYNS